MKSYEYRYEGLTYRFEGATYEFVSGVRTDLPKETPLKVRIAAALARQKYLKHKKTVHREFFGRCFKVVK